MGRHANTPFEKLLLWGTAAATALNGMLLFDAFRSLPLPLLDTSGGQPAGLDVS
jgi:hypothetical protein